MATRRTRNIEQTEAEELAEESEKNSETKVGAAGELVDAVRDVLGSLLDSGELVVSDRDEKPAKGGQNSGSDRTVRQQEESAYQSVVRALSDLGLTREHAHQAPAKEEPVEPEKAPEPTFSRLSKLMGWTDE